MGPEWTPTQGSEVPPSASSHQKGDRDEIVTFVTIGVSARFGVQRQYRPLSREPVGQLDGQHGEPEWEWSELQQQQPNHALNQSVGEYVLRQLGEYPMTTRNAFDKVST